MFADVTIQEHSGDSQKEIKIWGNKRLPSYVLQLRPEEMKMHNHDSNQSHNTSHTSLIVISIFISPISIRPLLYRYGSSTNVRIWWFQATLFVCTQDVSY